MANNPIRKNRYSLEVWRKQLYENDSYEWSVLTKNGQFLIKPKLSLKITPAKECCMICRLWVLNSHWGLKH